MAAHPQAISPLATAFNHRCPRCGKGALYHHLLVIRPACAACGLSFAEHDVGDGPAFFTITVLGFVVVGIAVWLELNWRIPLWQNLIVSTLCLLVFTPICLRWFKSYLIALKYRLNSATPPYEDPPDAC